MKDIDFDELDKAVSSLMGTSSAKDTSQPSPSDASAHNTPVPTEMPVTNTDTSTVQIPTTTVEQSNTEPKVQRSIVPQRKSGRFMDVVHPSSDMKSAGVGTLPKRRTVSMPAMDAPHAAADALDTSQATDSVPSPNVSKHSDNDVASIHQEPDTNSQMNESSATVDETSKENDHTWPDPLELQEQKTVEPPQEEATSSVNSLDDSSLSDAKQDSAPLHTSDISASSEVVAQTEQGVKDFSSPFLPDAKVEKRPLGGANDDDVQPTSETAASSVSGTLSQDTTVEANEENDSSTVTKQTPSEPLPEELNKDIIAIESGGGVTEPETGTAAPEKMGAEHAEMSSTTHDKVNAPLSGMTSISQQYKVKPSTETVDHAPIYDSSTQPLSHPTKTKSGWLTVVWILGLVILGVGGAAALYFLNIV